MIFDKVKKTIIDIIELEEDEILLESHLSDDLDADSLDMAQIFLALEVKYDILFDDNDISDIKTVNHIVNYIQNEINKK